MKKEQNLNESQNQVLNIPVVSHSIYCDDCGEEIHGLYEDHEDGTYTCISCDLKRQDGADIDNCMGCDW